MVILASEDVGLADPQALVVATAAANAVEYVGMPEAQLNLAQAALYLARAPKSNSVITALGRATEDARSNASVPTHLRDTHYPAAAKLGHGKGYRYPHEEADGAVDQPYLPDRFEGRRYYEPSGIGEDVPVRRHLGGPDEEPGDPER